MFDVQCFSISKGYRLYAPVPYLMLWLFGINLRKFLEEWKFFKGTKGSGRDPRMHLIEHIFSLLGSYRNFSEQSFFGCWNASLVSDFCKKDIFILLVALCVFGWGIWGWHLEKKSGIWGLELSITRFGTTNEEILNFHVGFIAGICNPQIPAQNLI